MANPNIVLTRIDNRLIHGQVATQWAKELAADLLLVANDEAAADTFRQELMNMAAPANAVTRYAAVKDVPAVIEKFGPDKRVFIIVANPEDALALKEMGLPIDKVNIGNMHMAEGKKQIATTVAVNAVDAEIFKKLRDGGTELIIQRIPNAVVEDVEKIWK